MKNLIIIGARGFGREVYYTCINSVGYGEQFLIKGFLDNQEGGLTHSNKLPPILGSVEDYEPLDDDTFVCGLGKVEDKKKYCRYILDKGGQFTSVIHQNVYVPPAVEIGEGVIIMSDVNISTDVEVGDFSAIMVKSVIGHDAKIGNWNHIGPFSFIGGGVLLHNDVQVHVRSTILAGTEVGEGAVTGAGSVVIKDVEPGFTVFGNPARKIGQFNN